MKICHLTSVHPPDDTRILLRECRSLARAGFDVSLVAPSRLDHVVDGVKIFAVPAAATRLSRMTRTVWDVYKKARALQADVYHFHDPELMFVGLLLRREGRRVIFDVHENIREQIRMKSWLPCRDTVATMFAPFDILAAAAFDLVLAEDSYRPIYERYTKRLTVVRNMPDVAFFDRFNLSDRRRCPNGIFYVGGVTAERGLDIVLAALRILRARGVDFSFHCIGPMSDAFARHVTASQALDALQSMIHFYGRLDLPTAYEISRNCRVGVAVLKPVANYVSSYPTKVFEYMAVSMPVIASDFDLYKNVVERRGAGVCVDPLNAECVADALALVLGDPERAAEMGRNGRAAVEADFSWDVEARKLLRLYGELAATRS